MGGNVGNGLNGLKCIGAKVGNGLKCIGAMVGIGSNSIESGAGSDCCDCIGGIFWSAGVEDACELRRCLWPQTQVAVSMPPVCDEETEQSVQSAGQHIWTPLDIAASGRPWHTAPVSQP
mmetsp:Transcript_27234/g.48585  ORF Transcript_27234/g.48585 Transcript_27234/m.48585 type:complete len:119 (-) Transcript_27234:556-912(-)